MPFLSLRISLATLLVVAGLTVPTFAHVIGDNGYAQLKGETKYFAHATSGKATLGRPLPDFVVKTIDGKTLSKASVQGKIGLFVMADTDCPCVKAIEERLKILAHKYGKQGLRITYVFPMPEQRPAQVARFMKSHQLPFVAVLDHDQRFTRMVNGQCLSEVYLTDKKAVLRYHGRVDDSTFDPKAVKSLDLENAILAVIQGKTPRKGFAPALGCAISRVLQFRS